MNPEKQMNTLTNKNDLRNVLKTCDKCYESTNKGSNIICHNKLSSMIVDKSSFKKKPFGLIINSSCNSDIIGHWFTCILTKPNLMIVCDGLNVILKQQSVVKSLKQFCTRNDLKLIDLHVRYQTKNSMWCGFLSIFWISAHSEFSPFKFRRLIECFRRNSIKSNEKYMLNYVYKHFDMKTSSNIFV